MNNESRTSRIINKQTSRHAHNSFVNQFILSLTYAYLIRFDGQHPVLVFLSPFTRDKLDQNKHTTMNSSRIYHKSTGAQESHAATDRQTDRQYFSALLTPPCSFSAWYLTPHSIERKSIEHSLAATSTSKTIRRSTYSCRTRSDTDRLTTISACLPGDLGEGQSKTSPARVNAARQLLWSE